MDFEKKEAQMADLVRDVINPQTIIELGQRMAGVYPGLDEAGFVQYINPKLGALTLTERLDLVTEALAVFLPDDFERAAGILIDSLGEELDAEADDPVAQDYASNRGFIVVALGNFIARHGMGHFELSMRALYEMTKRFSSEGPIRDFIVQDEARVLAVYEQWVTDPNVHVRRLVSESTRPRLPWTRQLPRFIEDPGPVLALLERLKGDRHLYVRRSVANNLNDIAKDNPDAVVAALERWQDGSKEMDWLTRHALRTLIKDGHPGALALLGYAADPDVAVEAFALASPVVRMGESLEFELRLSTQAAAPQKLVIDYVIYHMKANGKLLPKVFKWTQKEVVQGAPLVLRKAHAFREITTRKYYAGRHEVRVQINGREAAGVVFELEV